MRIVEFSLFTKLITKLLSDEEYRILQLFLAEYPEAGVLIPETKGLRKLRWSVKGHGKRGGMRVIYYWISSESVIYMISVFKKSNQEDLTKEQLQYLRKLLP